MSDAATLSSKDDSRLFELDGLRGWASLSVVFFHAFCELFGAVEPAFRNIFVVAFMNGGLAVAIFFVLSGEALSVPYWRSFDRRYVLRQMTKRYPRLTIPIFFSCLITIVLLKAGLVFCHDAAPAVHRQDWLGSFLSFVPSVDDFIWYLLYDVYGANRGQALSYDPLLWTMHTELFGSFLVFILLLIEPFTRTSARTRMVLLLGVLLAPIVLILKPFYACFLFGLLFGRLQGLGTFAALRKVRWLQPVSLLAIGGALLFGAAAQKESWLEHAGAGALLSRETKLTAVAVIVVFLCHCNRTATAFLRSRLSRALGAISFPLYLVQFSVLISFSSFAIVFVSGRTEMTIAAMIVIAVLTIAISIIASIIFLPVERMTHVICNWIARVVPVTARQA
jgi:peptidoglycan/LPS O-acetylase OafA/YrhL